MTVRATEVLPRQVRAMFRRFFGGNAGICEGLTDCIAAASTASAEAVGLFGEGCDCFSGINGREHEFGCPVRPNKAVSAAGESEAVVEAVARALARHDNPKHENWWPSYERRARVAITTLREQSAQSGEAK